MAPSRCWRSIGVALVGLTACGKPPVPLDQPAEDRVALSDTLELAHLTDALVGGDTLRVSGLFRGAQVQFRARPDPTALLEQQARSNPPAAARTTPIRLLTYNIAFLDVEALGLIQHRSPDLDARRPILGPTVFAQGYDLVCIQELWLDADLRRFVAQADAAGYWVAHSDRSGYTDGLAIAVKRSFSAGPTAIGHEHYPHMREVEFFPGPAVSRGFMWVKMQHETLGELVVYDTHMAPYPTDYSLRMEHARELGLHVREHTDPATQVILVAGDMNAAPYYTRDSWRLPNGQSEAVWFANTLSYPLLLYYGGLSDAFVRGRSVAEAALDISLGDAVPNDPSLATIIPGAKQGYCESTPNLIFTGTDCNSSYFKQYAGTEYPARLDHVLLRDPMGRVHAERSELVFTDLVDLGQSAGPLSDHFGVSVELQVADP